MQSISSHEDSYKRVEEQPIDKAGVEEDEEECDTDSDSDDPTAGSDDENLMFLPAVTTSSGRMVRIISQERRKTVICNLFSSFSLSPL